MLIDKIPIITTHFELAKLAKQVAYDYEHAESFDHMADKIIVRGEVVKDLIDLDRTLEHIDKKYTFDTGKNLMVGTLAFISLPFTGGASGIVAAKSFGNILWSVIDHYEKQKDKLKERSVRLSDLYDLRRCYVHLPVKDSDPAEDGLMELRKSGKTRRHEQRLDDMINNAPYQG